MAQPSRAAEIVLSPLVEASWAGSDRTQAYAPYAQTPSLDTRHDVPIDSGELGSKRGVLVFDLSGIDPARVVSITLGLVPIQYLPNEAVLSIEAIGLDQPRIDVDPFVYTLLGPLSAGPVPVHIEPCAGGVPCQIVPIPPPANSPQGWIFARELTPPPYPSIPADVTAAVAALDSGHPFLQLNLINVEGSGVQFGFGNTGGNFAPATLTIETPEPTLCPLLALAALGTARLVRGRR